MVGIRPKLTKSQILNVIFRFVDMKMPYNSENLHFILLYRINEVPVNGSTVDRGHTLV